MTSKNLLEIFYRALNDKTKVVEYTITNGVFVSLWWKHDFYIFDLITKTNRGCYTCATDRSIDHYSIRASNEQWAPDEMMAQKVEQISLIGLLTK